MAKKYYGESYAGEASRKATERSDGSMMSSSGSFANMPQQVVMRDWPTVGYNMPEGLNDSITGVDRQMKDDMKGKKPINSEKY